MLGALCIRPKPWLFSLLSLTSSTQHRLTQSPLKLITTNTNSDDCRRHHHSTACRIGCYRGGAASIWHAILPAGGNYMRPPVAFHEQKGEGSWNVAWDDRPARWLHRPDSAWLLFGVCGCIGGACEIVENSSDLNDLSYNLGLNLDVEEEDKAEDEEKVKYRVTGVPADGRCLFRAIAHVTCLRNGEEAPDEDRQRDLADDLRAEVVAELSRRRKETEWFIEGDFDTYVERIQRPYVWGGEPELLMASHVLRTKISVFMLDRSSDTLINIANYGEEYQKSDEIPIKLLFHGYGHYDIVDVPNDN